MIKREKNNVDTARWAGHPTKHVSYEFEFKGQVVTPGMHIKLKNDHAVYTFTCLVYDDRLDKTWIEVLGPYGFGAKTLDKIASIVGIKRSYKKKLVK